MYNLKQSSYLANFIGLGALAIWALTAPLLIQLERIPPFQLLTITSGVAFLLTTFNLTVAGKWRSIQQSPIIWIGGIGCFALSEIPYVISFHFAPAAHVDLINYLWPLFVGLFSLLMSRGKFSIGNLLSICLGFLGAIILILDRPHFSEISPETLFGYSLAFCSALGWGLYAIFSKYYQEIPTSMVGIYCGAICLISLITHLFFEEMIIPTLSEAWVLIFIGLAISGLSYLMWDYSIKKGNIHLLSLLAYFTPIATLCFLILSGKAEPSINLAISSFLIVFASTFFPLIEWAKLYVKKLPKRFVVPPIPEVSIYPGTSNLSSYPGGERPPIDPTKAIY